MLNAEACVHSHRDLNSALSSTDRTNLLGPIPSSLRIPAPRMRKPARADPSRAGERTSLSLKPAERNSLELITIATSGRALSTCCVGTHSRNVSPDAASSCHSAEPPLDHECTSSVVEACPLLILPRAMWQTDLLLATCAITCISAASPALFEGDCLYTSGV